MFDSADQFICSDVWCLHNLLQRFYRSSVELQWKHLFAADGYDNRSHEYASCQSCHQSVPNGDWDDDGNFRLYSKKRDLRGWHRRNRPGHVRFLPPRIPAGQRQSDRGVRCGVELLGGAFKPSLSRPIHPTVSYLERMALRRGLRLRRDVSAKLGHRDGLIFQKTAVI